MIAIYLIGSLGTMIGVIVAMRVVNGAEHFGPLYRALGGMFAGTYIGGSVNFNAIALEYDVMRNGALYGGSVAVDNVATALWMMATIAAPRVLLPLWRRPRRA